MNYKYMQNIANLTLACFECAGVLTGTLTRVPPNASTESISNFGIESLGFILAYLCASQGISMDEAASCATCFSSYMDKKNREKTFNQISKVIDFYLRVLIKFRKSHDNDFFLYSILIYNLTNPTKWNDFENGYPLEQMNVFDILKSTTDFVAFLTEYLPKKVNPILESFN